MACGRACGILIRSRGRPAAAAAAEAEAEVLQREKSCLETSKVSHFFALPPQNELNDRLYILYGEGRRYRWEGQF